MNDIRSCYTGGDALGRGFVGTDSLRDAGARVVMVLPLWAQRVRLGSVVLAHSRPFQLTGEEVRPLETLADHAASALASRRRAVLPSPLMVRRDRRAPGRSGGPLPTPGGGAVGQQRVGRHLGRRHQSHQGDHRRQPDRPGHEGQDQDGRGR